MKQLAILASLLAVAGCAAPACQFAGQRPMLVVALYFGRGIPGGGEVSDTQWSGFAAEVIGRRFPDGFTVFDAAGQWRSPATGRVGREATKVVQIVAPASPDLRPGIEAVVAAYKQQYHQEAVGVVSSLACAAF